MDFRSDSVAAPTPAMKDASGKAAPDMVRKAEAELASLLGKEAGLLIPDRLGGNLCGALAYAAPGTELLAAERSYLVQRQSGEFATATHLALRPVSPDSPHIRVEDVFVRIRDRRDERTPNTGVVCIEQPTEDGTLMPPEACAEIFRVAHKKGLPVFMDGARLFHAAAASGTGIKRLAHTADLAAVSVGKAIGTGTATLLAGKAEGVERARKTLEKFPIDRNSLPAEAARVLAGIEGWEERARADVERAKRLCARLKKMAGVRVPRDPDVNLLFIKLPGFQGSPESLIERMKARGILLDPPQWEHYRLAFHRDIGDEQADTLLKEIGSILSSQGPPPGVN